MAFHKDPDIDWLLRTASAAALEEDLSRFQTAVKKVSDLPIAGGNDRYTNASYKDAALQRTHEMIEYLRLAKDF